MEDNFRKVLEEAEKLTNKKFTELDTQFLVDLLLEMSNDFKDSVVGWAATNMENRLKLELSLNDLPKNKWLVTIRRTIRDINAKFKRNPSLRKWLETHFNEAWERAIGQYEDAQLEYGDLKDIPYKECPWTLEDILEEVI